MPRVAASPHDLCDYSLAQRPTLLFYVFVASCRGAEVQGVEGGVARLGLLTWTLAAAVAVAAIAIASSSLAASSACTQQLFMLRCKRVFTVAESSIIEHAACSMQLWQGMRRVNVLLVIATSNSSSRAYSICRSLSTSLSLSLAFSLSGCCTWLCSLFVIWH